MKILFATAQPYPSQGGISSYIDYNTSALRAKGHEVDILCFLDVQKLLTNADFNKGKEEAFYIEQKLVPRLRKGLAHMEVIKNWLKFMYSRVDFSSYDLIHSQDGITSSVIRSYTDKPLIQTIHSSFLDDALRDIPDLSKGEMVLLNRYDNFALTVPDRVITVSSYIPPVFNSFPVEKHSVVYNGVDPTYFQPKERQPFSKLQLITVGRLDLVKGYDVLLHSLLHIRNHYDFPYTLTICGKGTIEEHLKSFVEKHQLPVVFKGQTDKKTTRSLLQQSDVFIQPSRSETFGLAITESMACGCVPICTNVGGIPEQVEHMRNGLLVESQDPTGLAQAIQQLAENHTLRDQLRQEAIFRATTEFTIEQSIAQLLDVYTKQLAHAKNQR